MEGRTTDRSLLRSGAADARTRGVWPFAVLLATLAAHTACAAPHTPLDWSADTALTVSGPRQHITVRAILWRGREAGEYEICVDRECRRDTLWDRVSSAGIVDIDSRDARLEIVVSTRGPSDDHQSSLWTWQGGRLVALGRLESELDGLSSDGTIAVDRQYGFWFHRETWRYRADRLGFRRDPLPRDIPVAVTTLPDSPIRTMRPLALRAVPDSSVTPVLVPAGVELEFEVYRIVPCPRGSGVEAPGGACGWYRIRTARGRVGWIPQDDLHAIEGLPWAD